MDNKDIVIPKGQYVSLIGPIASGKSTLVKLLENAGAKAVFETAKDTQILRSYYENPRKYALENQLTFLINICYSIKSNLEGDKGFIIDDSPYLVSSYSEFSLEGVQREAFYNVFRAFELSVPKPAALIYLNCDPKILLDRIHARNRESEQNIGLDFLNKISSIINKKVQELSKYNHIIEIDSSKINFLQNEYDKEKVIEILRDKIL